MPATQNFKSHAAFDPAWHFFVLPVSFLNIVVAMGYTIHMWPLHRGLDLWWIVMSLALFFTMSTARMFGLKNQDRIIRLEERLRYRTLLTPAALVRSEELTLRQIIALRFASDAELPGLIERTLGDKLEPKQIKQAITDWRADYHRI